jgi:hypothetical protein
VAPHPEHEGGDRRDPREEGRNDDHAAVRAAAVTVATHEGDKRAQE